MSDTKSPAELESEARRQTPAAHDPPGDPAELEAEARRIPAQGDELPAKQ